MHCIDTDIISMNVDTAMGGFLGLNIVYTYAASGEVTGKSLETAWSCTNLWSGVGILFSPVFSGVYILKLTLQCLA